MKISIKLLALLAISLAFVFTACKKDDSAAKGEDEYLKSASYAEADLMMSGEGDFEKVIASPLVKLDGCDFIVSGTIEYYEAGELSYAIDFGDGTCDEWAAITKDGYTSEISLAEEKGDKEEFYKVIAEPIVKLEGCDYIVSGVIEFYSITDKSWLATINFGDGTCDEWATKTWEGDSKVFSMANWKEKGE